jgi:hypothetical protein
MTLRNIASTLAGVVVVAASATAGTVIWLLLTAPTTVASAIDGHATGAVPILVRALYAALAHLVSYF